MLILPALLLFRFGGIGQGKLNFHSDDMMILTLVILGSVILVSVVSTISHLLWSKHMPSHLELALDLVFAVGLCFLGTLLLLLDHGELEFGM